MNLQALRARAYRPAPDRFSGSWSAVLWQPELAGVQAFVVGVHVRGAEESAFKLMDEPGRIECFFRPEPIAQDFAWLMSSARATLAELPSQGPAALPVMNLTLTSPKFVRGESAQAIADELFAQLVPAARPLPNARPKRTALDTLTVRELVHEELKRIANLDYERIVREANEVIHDRGDHTFDIDIVTERGVGSVISADYAGTLSIERNLLRAAQDVGAYAAARNKAGRAIFIYDPQDRPGLSAEERRDIERFLGGERWKLECNGFQVPTNFTPNLLAQDVKDWAMPLL